MKVVPLGRTGLYVSQICLGAMNFGQNGWGCDESEARLIVDTFLDAGGIFFDTADAYAGGASEEILGRALRGRRDDVVLATKVGNRTGDASNDAGSSRKHVISALHGSLRRLGTDYIDLYQLHHFDHVTPIEETLGVLDDCVRAGKVRYVGCSNFFPWQVAEANAIAAARGISTFASCQMMYNLVRRDLEREYFEFSNARGIGLITYSPLHSGILSGAVERDRPPPPDARIAAHPQVRAVYLGDEERAWKVVDAVRLAAEASGRSMSEIALGWVLRESAISSVLIGVRRVSELERNLSVLSLEVPPEVWDDLDETTRLPPSYPSDFYARLLVRPHHEILHSGPNE